MSTPKKGNRGSVFTVCTNWGQDYDVLSPIERKISQFMMSGTLTGISICV